MVNENALRQHLLELLHGGNAHTTFDDAMADFPFEYAGMRPGGSPHSAWELLEHLRIAQNDILQFCQSAEYHSPPWPKGYWPAAPAPASEAEWHASAKAIRDDLTEFERILEDPARDLFARIPWGEGQTLLREALLIADHNSYHIGQLVLVRRLLGSWD
jgi:uncharacterized damage-inducible protein DinB